LAVHWEFVWVSLNIEHPKTSWIIIFIDFHSFSPFKVPFWGYTAIPCYTHTSDMAMWEENLGPLSTVTSSQRSLH
jgi:hypothetical protein